MIAFAPRARALKASEADLIPESKRISKSCPTVSTIPGKASRDPMAPSTCRPSKETMREGESDVENEQKRVANFGRSTVYSPA